jgi:hypothetical protein
MRQATLIAIGSLERAAAAQLAAAHAELISLQAQRARLLAGSSGARRELLEQTTWSGFACAVLANHLAKCAALSAHNLARQRAVLARGARLLRVKRRWAAAHRGLLRRAARSKGAPRWRD